MSRSTRSWTRSRPRWTSARRSCPATSWTAASCSPVAARTCAAWTSGCDTRRACRSWWRTTRCTRWRSGPAAAWRTSTRYSRSSSPSASTLDRPQEPARGVRSGRSGWEASCKPCSGRGSSGARGGYADIRGRDAVTAPTRGQRRAVVLLLLVCAVLITVDHRGDTLTGARSAARSVVDPMQRGVAAAVAPVGRFFGGLDDLGDSRGRIDELERQNAELRRRLREGELTASRAEQLRRLSLLAGQGQFPVVPATVTGVGPSLGFEWTVTVDAGSRDGVRPDQTVVAAEGLVGRVKRVTAGSAVIVLAIDPDSSAGVRLAGGGQ